MAVALSGPALAAGAPPPAAPPPAVPAALPVLREDLILMPGPSSASGASSWTIQDAAAHKFYRIGWMEFEILSRWGLGSAAAIADAVNRSGPLRIAPEQVAGVARFLEANDLVDRSGAGATEALVQRRALGATGPAMWLLKNYLFIRLKLINPDRLLDRLVVLLGWLFTPATGIAVAAIAVTGLVLVLREWDVFLADLRGLATPSGLALTAVAIMVSHVLHEVGHGIAAKRFGCRVPAMGVALLILWPVLWTDTTEAWKLRQRRKRLAVDGAGIMVELTLAALCSIAWALLPDGPLRAAAHVLATTTWITTLAINLNPFMRFDGYYLMSDLLDVPNLQDRSFALGRWWMRERLFGWGDPVPEALPRARRRLLVAYALATWVYRFFLFLGIALLVYHLAFKALGIFLMVVELWWFIARPVGREIKVWLSRRGGMRWTRQSVRTSILAFLFLLALVVPWRGTIAVPGVIHARDEALVFTREAGSVVRIDAANGQDVAAGDILLVLDSPDIRHRLDAATARRTELHARLDAAALDQRLSRDRTVIAGELARVEAELAAIGSQVERLNIRAPIAGRLTDIPSGMQAGAWLPAGEPVALITDATRQEVEAFIPEEDLHRIVPGAAADFHLPDEWRDPIAVRLAEIDRVAVTILDRPELASAHGGPIPATQNGESLIPDRSIYRARLEALGAEAPVTRVRAGTVFLTVERESLLAGLWRRVLEIFRREGAL